MTKFATEVCKLQLFSQLYFLLPQKPVLIPFLMQSISRIEQTQKYIYFGQLSVSDVVEFSTFRQRKTIEGNRLAILLILTEKPVE